jgi:Ca2+-binding EF-hand superfamily protein
MADLLVELLEGEPDIEEINLDDKDIEDLEELLPLLSKFQNLRALSLADNRLVSFPHDLSCLEAVEDINLNGNMFHDLKQVILALTTMPSLRSLHINLHEEEQVDFIFRNMPNLEMLNDTEVEREEFEGEGDQQYEEDEEAMMNGHTGQSDAQSDDNQQEQESEQQEVQEEEDDDENQIRPDDQKEDSGDEMDDIVIKPEDLEIIAVLYDSIRALRRRIDEENDKNLADDFDRHLKNVMTELNESITTDDPTHIKNANLLKAKFSLYEICFTKAVEYMKVMDEDVGNVFEKIQDGQNSIFESFYELTRNSGGVDTEMIRNQLIEKENEATEVIETANALNMRFEKEMKDKENIKRNFERERTQLKKQIESLESENKKLLDTLIRHSKGEAPEMEVPQSRSNQVSGHPLFRGTQSKKYNKLSGPVGKTHVRTLTLKQLKDVINDIYAQKLKYDQKCVESKLPRETMEQYMYTYLNQRYGLKSLIIEWVAAIINGIKTYLKQDHDVALFGKILKNECDEEFRFIQTHVKETLVGLLKALLRERFSLKSENEINKMMREIERGSMEEWQWRKIIEKMYDPNDYEILEQKFINAVQERRAKSFYSNLTDSRKMTREEQMLRMQQRDFERLQFTDFQKIILDFQLKEHEKFLEKFIAVFKSIDSDNNGVINEAEFRELVQSMDVIQDEDEVNYLLQMIDPFNNQQMTFSELVHLFSSHMVPVDERDPQRSIPLLEKFVSQGHGSDNVGEILKEEDSNEENEEDDEAIQVQ